MWNPFIGRVFKSVLANLEASLRRDPRDVYLLYLQPDLEHLVKASPFLRRLWLEGFEMTKEDYAAYAFRNSVVTCSAYRSISEFR